MQLIFLFKGRYQSVCIQRSLLFLKIKIALCDQDYAMYLTKLGDQNITSVTQVKSFILRMKK